MVFEISNNISISRLCEENLRQDNPLLTCVQMKDDVSRSMSPIIEIHSFCFAVQAAAEKLHSEDRIVVCSARNDDSYFAQACLYIGAYLVLHCKVQQYDDIAKAFQAVHEPLEAKTLDCWRALDRALHFGWLAPPDSDIEPTFDAEEFAHYASAAQGRVYLAVPGALHFFPTPDDLLGDQEWADHIEDGRTVRVFGAHFYAELFQDMGLSLVVCLGRSSAATAAAFGARGIETVNLDLAADGSSLLRGLDRLLSLAREAPGAVAVHSGDGFEWPAYAGTLAVAFMISRFGLEEGAAKAWLGMVVPWMFGEGGDDPAPPPPSAASFRSATAAAAANLSHPCC